MTYVIVGNCINDTACVDVCPVDCIHPAPNEIGFKTADMLFIDPKFCIDCNACAEACPIDAVMPAHKLPKHFRHYQAINAEYSIARLK
ncbi:4Fe-4S dicluster domain-containing protein [Zhongshania aquimaris]|uniref:Ferredoxin family protein n=1 Tax=Zhongshania aquimaris TaxID=2857107 RepID=A0ABS6VV16_9GAMM|nr:ferredoxin family protein [Zhongshania aquimaris]MBW2942178.1 ferredoxin family protein [Zhongshania aquimaris]